MYPPALHDAVLWGALTPPSTCPRHCSRRSLYALSFGEALGRVASGPDHEKRAATGGSGSEHNGFKIQGRLGVSNEMNLIDALETAIGGRELMGVDLVLE